jgi:hypothetical protein
VEIQRPQSNQPPRKIREEKGKNILVACGASRTDRSSGLPFGSALLDVLVDIWKSTSMYVAWWFRDDVERGDEIRRL